ncbi:MAG: hypothetical protein IIA49_12710 [Bacteroidetes bacterium]|nr:hypothetical protein [Bacteroidota bacterium]
MEFNPSSGSNGIVQEITYLLQLQSQTTDYPTADLTRNVNRWYDRATYIITRADNRWQWDDNNQSDLPIATAALVSGQNDYGIAAGTFLRITKVAVRRSVSDTTYTELVPVDIHDSIARRIFEEKSTTDGTPVMYDKTANSILLEPAPNYASSDGLKIAYQRVPDYFTTSDTTQQPGFAEIFHRFLSLGACFDYALSWSMHKRMKEFDAEIIKMEAAMTDWYTQRPRDEKPQIRLRKESYGTGQERRLSQHADRRFDI